MKTRFLTSWSACRNASRPEFWFIAIILFSLPLIESTKNIFGAALLIGYIIVSFRERSFGSSLPFEWPIWFLVGVLWVAVFTSDYRFELNLANEGMRWTQIGIVAIICGRLSYSSYQARILLVAFLLGAVLAVAESFWVWSWNGKTYPELNSVGQVNHSALFILVSFAAGLGALRSGDRLVCTLGAATTIASILYLIPSRSFVAVATAVVLFFIFITPVFFLSRYRKFAAISLVAVTAGLAILGSSSVTSEFRGEFRNRLASPEEFFSQRDKILYMALEVYDRHPLFGSGAHTFGLATREEIVRQEVLADGRSWSEFKPNFYPASHGHNLWTNALIERGVTGVVLFTILILLQLKFFYFQVPRQTEIGIGIAMSVTAKLAIIGFAVAGLGNTTLQNEHGQAGLMLAAIAAQFLTGTKRGTQNFA